MSSTNEELPPKPRVSPLDFRNTDLVSRLLAATPPYLYNMPLVPNSYFFSEMLRSLVQAKTEATNRTSMNMHQRRSRKRSWTQARNECYKSSPKPEQTINWPPKFKDDAKNVDTPLELTINKLPPVSEKSSPVEENKVAKHEIPAPLMYPTPTPANTSTQDGNLIMPPPPIWYPSLYPSPYGIDPLHFFIDLRVSGHIYDRKNQKDNASSPHIPPRIQPTSDQATEQEVASPIHNFRQTRHASAFSVPIPSVMNLSSETKNTKFDVKSMGFDKSYSKTSTNYVMSNIGNIYKTLNQENSLKNEEIQVDESPVESEEKAEETEEEKQKRVKDLRALIGLELVVDYMNHAKPGQPQETFEDSSVDAESTASSAVEVVSVEESSPNVLTY